MSQRESEGADAASPFRKVTDARALRALAHPTRIALLEAVGLNGPLTATEAARIVGGTVANASYHLRTLARYDYVVEAEGGTGRERPWRIGSVGMSYDSEDPDPTVGHAARALSGLMSERWLGRIRHYQDHREQYPDAVRTVSGSSQFVLFGTPDEVEQAQTEVLAVLTRFVDRLADPAARPVGAVPFEVIVSTHPLATAATDPEGRPAP
ncbi:helix-turn-helix transcriptional regulator [Streptacidiphilus sp. PB12-B1b]|uniref:winged helix-turn-helix domain-containing protein n=1 Tax=Streptacidiphilus sp. PB12-B1b TaxID=2705012 RepID=UPI0015FCFB6F|nr:helix-turn-helix domain-containing protein [Streptacidiphilus sp. PB12-B1b]QMU77565.1 helix-turn-helix transcriptional regulator [Streptacidiphilus sp. PB12-B1b]